MTGDPHDHARPGRAAQRATLAIAVAVLTANRDAAVEAAAAITCPVCLALAITGYWVNVCAVLDGDPGHGAIAPTTRAKLLAAARAAQQALDADATQN